MNKLETENLLSGFLTFFPKVILYLVGWSLLVSGVFFLFGANLKNPAPVIVLVLLLAGVSLAWEYIRVFGISYKRIIGYLTISIAIISIATFFIGKIYDKSWDGMTYHQIAILKISEGWNPIYEVLPFEEQSSKYFDRKIILNRWVNHYAKGLEIFSALLMGITGNIESGKVFNLLLLIASFSLTLKMLISLKRIGIAWCVLIAFAASFNPITVNQIFSYYLDGAVGSLLLMLSVIMFSMMWDSSRRSIVSSLISAFFVIIILVNLKFTTVVYAAFFCFSFLVILLLQKNYVLMKQATLAFVVAGILAVGLAGVNPYITNTLYFGHPFHPLAGNHKVDIISINIPTELKDSNSAQKFFSSTFSESDNFDNRNSEKIKYKYPFTFTLSEIKAFQSEGIRLGGFGVFWSGLLVLTVVLFFLISGNLKSEFKVSLLLVLLFLLISVGINPESWWARYVPQLWLFPGITCLYALYFSKQKLSVYLSKALVLIMILNTTIILVVYSYSSLKTSMVADRELAKLRKLKSPVKVYFDIFSPNERKLSSLNIPYIKVNKPEDLSCNDVVKVLKIEYCK